MLTPTRPLPMRLTCPRCNSLQEVYNARMHAPDAPARILFRTHRVPFWREMIEGMQDCPGSGYEVDFSVEWMRMRKEDEGSRTPYGVRGRWLRSRGWTVEWQREPNEGFIATRKWRWRT